MICAHIRYSIEMVKTNVTGENYAWCCLFHVFDCRCPRQNYNKYLRISHFLVFFFYCFFFQKKKKSIYSILKCISINFMLHQYIYHQNTFIPIKIALLQHYINCRMYNLYMFYIYVDFSVYCYSKTECLWQHFNMNLIKYIFGF